jgi:hypothetical protein
MKNEDFEKIDCFPLAAIECLISDLEHIHKLAHKRKNKDKIDVLAYIAKENMEQHFVEIYTYLDKANISKINDKDYSILQDKS